MYLIVGLGNPEKEYRWTRHNVGFEVINKLAYDNNIEINKSKFRAHLGEGIIDGKKVMLAKPQTYMNLSGESVRDIVNFYKIPKEKLIVVYDDIDLNVGDVRIREKGSSGGHNGIKNILLHLESEVFTRVRVGVGIKPKEWDLAKYVLSKFAKSEEEEIIKGITDAGNSVEMILRTSVSDAMNKYNKKAKIIDETKKEKKMDNKNGEAT